MGFRSLAAAPGPAGESAGCRHRGGSPPWRAGHLEERGDLQATMAGVQRPSDRKTITCNPHQPQHSASSLPCPHHLVHLSWPLPTTPPSLPASGHTFCIRRLYLCSCCLRVTSSSSACPRDLLGLGQSAPTLSQCLGLLHRAQSLSVAGSWSWGPAP